MTEHKNLKGSITISRPRGSHGPDYAQIDVLDSLSYTRVLTIRMPLEVFAEALLGLGRVDCEFDFMPEHVGKRREHKQILVPLPKSGYYERGPKRDAIAREVLAPFEVDGWIGDADDLFNHHRQGPNGATVSFVRYVECEGEKP